MKFKLGLGFLVLMILVAIFAPLVAPFSFSAQNLDRILLVPNSVNWMGTDDLGRDLFSRVVYGARVSLLVGLITSFFALIFGLILGSLAGYAGGKLDTALSMFFDLMQSIPMLVMMILVTVFFSRFHIFQDPHLQGVFEVVAALSLISWIGVARLVRGQVIEMKGRPFVEAAQALGSPPSRVVFRHILPNIMGALIVLLTFQVPTNIMLESFLSFLGLGLQPPYSSWGVLAAEGWRSLRAYPHLIYGPGTVLFLTMLSFNFIGDGLRKKSKQ